MTETVTNPSETAAPMGAAEGYAKYRHLRANVARRRAWYKVFIVLAVLVLAFSLVDIIYLDSAAKLGVYAAYAVLFLFGLILLLSRKRSQEEIAQLKALEKALLQCPECKNIFQFAEANLSGRQKIAFSCPACGTYSALPDPETEPVKAPAPAGALKELAYACENCHERIAVGVFGDQSLHASRFRACPHCGEKNRIKPVPPSEAGAPVQA